MDLVAALPTRVGTGAGPTPKFHQPARVCCRSRPAIRIRLRFLFPPQPVFHPLASVCTAAAGHFPKPRPAAAADPTAPPHSSPCHRRRSKLARAQFPECGRLSHWADNSVSVEKLISRLARFPRRGPARCLRLRADSMAELRSVASRWDWTAVAPPLTAAGELFLPPAGRLPAWPFLRLPVVAPIVAWPFPRLLAGPHVAARHPAWPFRLPPVAQLPAWPSPLPLAEPLVAARLPAWPFRLPPVAQLPVWPSPLPLAGPLVAARPPAWPFRRLPVAPLPVWPSPLPLAGPLVAARSPASPFLRLLAAAPFAVWPSPLPLAEPLAAERSPA